MKKPSTFKVQLRTAQRLRVGCSLGRWALGVQGGMFFVSIACGLAGFHHAGTGQPGGYDGCQRFGHPAGDQRFDADRHGANNTSLNWQSFNIAAGETTVFVQPSSTSIVWNSIGGGSASQIYGSLQANGVVVLMNPSGFYFGPDSCVKAAGVIVSTAAGGPVDSGNGTAWQFTGPAATASIINYGKISADSGGFVYLLGANIDNEGSITAPAGNIGLCAGQTVLLSERADGRGLSAKVTLPTGSVEQQRPARGRRRHHSRQRQGRESERTRRGQFRFGGRRHHRTGRLRHAQTRRQFGHHRQRRQFRVRQRRRADHAPDGRHLFRRLRFAGPIQGRRQWRRRRTRVDLRGFVRRQIHAGRHRAIRLHRRRQVLLSALVQSHAGFQLARSV
jgi:filamentous hemagglutinin family protein